MDFLSGSKKEFLDYLNHIEEKDKIAVITHIDLDGIASAVLISEILKNKKSKIEGINFVEYGKGMFEKSQEEFAEKKINKIFISDINVSSDYEGFEKLKKNFDVLVIDHHPSDLMGKNIIRTKSSDCVAFALYELARENVDLSKLEWLVCSTIVSEYSFKDKDNFDFIKQHYPKIIYGEINNSEPGEISKRISSALIYFKGNEKKVYDLILKNDLESFNKYYNIVEKEVRTLIDKFKKEAEFYPKQNLYFYYTHPKYSVTSIITTLLSAEKPEKTFVFVSDINGEPDFYKVSSRNQSGKEDMNLLMKKGIAGLENANGGGHIPAAGARFMKKDFEKFKKNLLD